MLSKSIKPDHFTFTILLKGCTQLPAPEFGKQLHCLVIKNGLNLSIFIRRKLVHLYAVLEWISDARKIFDTTTKLNIVTWNSLLKGYANNRDGKSLYEIFDEIPQRDVVSWNTMIAFYVNLSDFEKAMWLF
ncbi:hypothetical protein GIB67_001551 [Kingdonia uniflora]|uniref:Pentatricopeptide repeat-containing protein n=1 Tax=Kingdonia uniflora TaxID=39325 RepID=A0A7J7L6W4_9MAGN|nr:hypothetical protein GIB67_001551 [Kingdonia uniflora]